MSCASGPSTVISGLVLDLDAGNTAESARGFNSILDLSTWTLGTGGTSNFNINGTVAENQRILDTGPFGVSTMVWDTPSNDVTSDADGGWNTTNIAIDPTKLYRFSTWMRRKTIGDGEYYLGVYGLDASFTNTGVLARSSGAVNTTLYFSASTWPASILANEWMLIVGHVWPAGSGIGSDNPNSGLWNTAGTKFSNSTSSGDAVWQSTNVYTIHRSYLYYSTVTATNQQWYQPRIDLCDGTEPSVADLIAGFGSKWYNVVATDSSNIFNAASLYNSAGYMQFDGVDDYTTIAMPATTGTVSFWYYYNANTTNKLIMGNSSSMIYCGGGAGGGHWYNQSGDYSFAFTWGNTSQWLHMCGVYESDTTNRFYINGQLSYSSTTYSIPKGTTYNVAGGFYNPQACRFGQISTYNRALSGDEVQQNFNALRGRYGI